MGKSSLLNHLVGEKAAIVTPKPQTTRTRITGIYTDNNVQFVFFDTPGIHLPRTKLGSRMQKIAQEGVSDGDVVLMLFEPSGEFTQVEREMAEGLKGRYAIAAVNKADTVRLGEELAKRVEQIKELGVFEQVLVMSAHTGEGCEQLMEALRKNAVSGPHYFADDVYTDQPERQLVAEIVREKLLLNLREEIPHGTAVEIESFKDRKGGRLVDIDAVIYCEKKSHKGIIIGKEGAMLKLIGSSARQDAQELLGTKINFKLWVKVRENWRDKDNLLKSLGFGAK